MSDSEPPFESYDESVAGQKEWEDLQEIAVGRELQRVLERLRLGRHSAALARMGIDTLADVGNKTPNALVTKAGLSPAECHALLSELLVGAGRPVGSSGQRLPATPLQRRSPSPEDRSIRSAERSPSSVSTFDTLLEDETERVEQHAEADLAERLAEIQSERAERQRVAARKAAQRAELEYVAQQEAEEERLAAQRDRLAAAHRAKQERLLVEKELEDLAADQRSSSPRRIRAAVARTRVSGRSSPQSAPRGSGRSSPRGPLLSEKERDRERQRERERDGARVNEASPTRGGTARSQRRPGSRCALNAASRGPSPRRCHLRVAPLLSTSSSRPRLRRKRRPPSWSTRPFGRRQWAVMR